MYKRNWEIKVNLNGFEVKVYVYGTEQETRAYIDSELPGWKSMVGATDKDMEAARMLKLKVYLAPEMTAAEFDKTAA